MANKVFANGREISCKAAAGKTICAMPDVCFTPPENPATPPGVPVPYPNTGMASDTTSGSKSVKITNKEVGIKNQSFFKKSMGDEAGCAAKKGVVTSTNTGKVYFKSWSMNVKFEGQNAIRHLDMTTDNHMAANPGDTPPWPYLDGMAPPPPPPSTEDCRLRPYSEGCEDGKTPHHCVPDHCFKEKGDKGKYYPGTIKHADGLCACVEGATKSSTPSGNRVKQADFPTDEAHTAALAQHGKIHKKFDKLEKELGAADGTAKLGDLEDAAAEVIAEETGCDKDNLKKQMRDYHKSNPPPNGMSPDTRLRAQPSGGPPPIGPMGSNAAVGGGASF
jgi:hypothetical protein